MEGKINFFANEHEGTNKPHFKGYIEIGGEVHDFAVWPAKTGKGWSGRYKPKTPKEEPSNVTQADADRAWAAAKDTFKQSPASPESGEPFAPDSEIPF